MRRAWLGAVHQLSGPRLAPSKVRIIEPRAFRPLPTVRSLATAVMPPKGKGKRKAKEDTPPASSASDDDDGPKQTKEKKAKKAKEAVQPLDPDLPTNKEFPKSLTFEAKKPDHVRFSTWNVCGIKAAEKKGLKVYLEAEDADVVILTETKVSEEPDFLHIKTRYKYRYFGSDPQKGYAGVAVLSKSKPLNVVFGLPTWKTPELSEGRFIQLEFKDFFVLGCYTPNAGQSLKNIETKNEWNEAFEKHLRVLDKVKPVVWGGDINCALTEKDLRNAKTNWNKTPGYSEAECTALAKQLDPGVEGVGKLVDVWRQRHPDLLGHYTYYSYRQACREKGIGWRLDTFIVSDRLLPRVSSCEIRQECYGASDHVPVYMDLSGSLDDEDEDNDE